MIINIKVDGDYTDGKFAPLSIVLNRDIYSVNILLTSEQTNESLEYDSNFRMHPLKDICADSGFTTHQVIEIINGDESDAQHEFISKMSDLTEDPFREEICPIEIEFSNPQNPDDGNIKLISADEFEFTIFTESDELSPTQTAEVLKLIFNQEA